MTDRSIVKLKNGKLLFGWGERMELNEPSLTYPCWFQTDFFLKEKRWYSHPFYAVVDSSEFLLNEGKKRADWQPIKGFEPFFNESKGAIIAKKLDKIVPYTYQEANFTPNAPFMLNHLLQNNQELYLYGSWNDEEGFLGATPEMLFEIYENKIWVYAVAGTAAAPELFTMKEVDEHNWVVKGIQDRFKSYGTLTIHPREVRPFHSYFHLVTPIEFLGAKNPSFNELVDILHPTPALGSYPKEQGEKMLKRWDEIIERGIYGTPFGYMFNGEARAYVAIRNIQWKDGISRIFVGSGVTSSSQYEQEWSEICLKAESVKELLGV